MFLCPVLNWWLFTPLIGSISHSSCCLSIPNPHWCLGCLYSFFSFLSKYTVAVPCVKMITFLSSFWLDSSFILLRILTQTLHCSLGCLHSFFSFLCKHTFTVPHVKLMGFHSSLYCHSSFVLLICTLPSIVLPAVFMPMLSCGLSALLLLLRILLLLCLRQTNFSTSKVFHCVYD